MSEKHTQGRLHLTSQDDLPTGSASFDPMAGVDTIVLYHDNAKADARRLVACWNACEGIAPDDLEAMPAAYMLAKLQMVIPLFQEARDALTALTEAQRKLHGISPSLADRMDEAGTFSVDDWRAAIARVKGGPA